MEDLKTSEKKKKKKVPVNVVATLNGKGSEFYKIPLGEGISDGRSLIRPTSLRLLELGHGATARRFSRFS